MSFETLREVEERVNRGQRLDDIFLDPSMLDMAPDIFPPHTISAFVERDRNQGITRDDNWRMYVDRVVRSRKESSLRPLARQLRSAAKADATRRTTAIHPICFGDVERPSLQPSSERYFTFFETRFEAELASLPAPTRKLVDFLVDQYRDSQGADVLTTFLELMSVCQVHGLGVQRESKHKYPVHGLLYGGNATLPVGMRSSINGAGRIVLDDLVSCLEKPDDALFFSIDFFLDEDGGVWMGRDIHEQQIGMGLQKHFVGGFADGLFEALPKIINARSNSPVVGLNYDPVICRQNRLYAIELAVLREALQASGFTVEDNSPAPYALRLFGGKSGVPTSTVTSLTDDKLLIDDLLGKNKERLKTLGVNIASTYRCQVSELVDQPSKAVEVLGDSKVFVHPTRHHAFKPFEVDLNSSLDRDIIRETFSKKGAPSLTAIPVVAMRRIPNAIGYEKGSFPHEVRAYFAPMSCEP